MPTPVIHDRQDSKWPSVGQRIMHKIHTPALGRPHWCGRGASVEGDVFPAPYPHAQLQPIQAIQSANVLPIDQPTFTP